MLLRANKSKESGPYENPKRMAEGTEQVRIRRRQAKLQYEEASEKASSQRHRSGETRDLQKRCAALYLLEPILGHTVSRLCTTSQHH